MSQLPAYFPQEPKPVAARDVEVLARVADLVPGVWVTARALARHHSPIPSAAQGDDKRVGPVALALVRRKRALCLYLAHRDHLAIVERNKDAVSRWLK